MPLEGTKYGLIRSISFENESVNENKSTKPGNQYSLKGVTALEDAAKQAEINRLLERELEEVRAELKKQTAATERAKGELKRSTPSVRKDAVDKLVRKLLREYSSYADAEEISARLKALGDELVQSETVDWDHVWEQVYRIAETVVDDAQEIMDTSDLELFREIRRKLKDTKILMSEADRGDIPDYNLFRVQNMSRLRLNSKEGMPLDEFWEALHGEYGELFPAELTGASDRLNYLVEKLDRDWKPMTYNPHDEYGREGVIVTLAQTMIAQVMEESIRTPKTFADKQYEQQEQLRRMLKEQREKMRTRYKERVEELTARYRGQLSEASESRKAAELRAKITRHVEQMSRRLLKPTKTMNVPAQLHGAVADVLAAINMESGFDWAIGADGKRHRVKRGTAAAQQKTDAQTREKVAAAEKRYAETEVNQELQELVKRVKSGDFKPNDRVDFGRVSKENAQRILEETGVNPEGYRVAIEARQIEHILKDHGQKGRSNQSLSNDDDLAKLEFVFDGPDSIIFGGRTRAYTHMQNGYNKTAPTVLYEKSIGEKSYYVVQAVPDTKAKTLFVVTAFIGDPGYEGQKKEAPQLINANRPDETPKSGSVETSKDSIPQEREKVNVDATQDETILPTKRTEAFLKLMAEYRKIKDENTDGVTIDPDLMGLKEGSRIN